MTPLYPIGSSRLRPGGCLRAAFVGAAMLALGAAASAQDRFAPVTKDAAPFVDPPLAVSQLADFDGDGDVDVLDRNRLFTNQGGRFVAWPSVLTGLDHGLVCRDFDGDGRVDVLTGNDASTPSGTSLRVWLNRLPTGFVAGSLSVNLGTLLSYAAADFDADGDQDLVLFPYSAVPARQFANDGLGNFTDVSAVRMPATAISLGACRPLDADRDGDLDLVVQQGVGQLAWMQNNGLGVLALPSTSRFPAGYGGILGSGDLDGDGDEDLCVGAGGVLLNEPAGWVGRPQVFPPLLGPQWASCVDFDGDSDLDVWLEAFYGGGYFENLGNVTFVDRRNPPIVRAAASPAITDVDGDGRLDVLTGVGRIEILLGQPGGRFHDSTRWQVLGDAYADFDGDGRMDQLYYTPFGGLTKLRRGLGAGDYVESTAMSGWINEYHAIVDLDGDGDLDVIGSTSTNSRMVLFFNSGTGQLTPYYPEPGIQTWYEAPQFVAPGDLDGDGDLDFVANLDPLNGPPQLLMFENQGSGTFAPKTAWTIPGLQGSRLRGVLFDADGDADPDLVVSGNDPQLYANDGTGAMALVLGAVPPLYSTTNKAPMKLLAGDVDRDGDVDLLAGYLVATGSGPADATLFLNDGLGSFTVGTTFAETSTWTTLDLVDVDDDTNLDLVCGISPATGPIRLEVRSNDGTGTFWLAASGFGGVSNISVYGQAGRSSPFLDFDDDGDIDIVGTSNHQVVVYNQTRHLRVVTQARLGGSLALEFSHPEPPAPRMVAFLVSTRRLATPLVLPGVGSIVVDPAAGALVLAIGAAAIPLHVAVPASSAFLGMDLFAQGALFQGSSVKVSNAIRETLVW